MSTHSLTSHRQRIAIWIIAIVMIVGTVAGLIFMVWATQDSRIDPNTIAQDEYLEQLQQQQEEYEKQAAEARKKLRAIDGYEDKVTSFDANSVTELVIETLKEGSGATISESDSLEVNYTGWTPDGQIFDSTKSDGEDARPQVFALSSLIDGWSALAGQKVGGVYLLSIPAEQAYGETGTSDGSIQPNTPIKFVVEVLDIDNSSAE